MPRLASLFAFLFLIAVSAAPAAKPVIAINTNISKPETTNVGMSTPSTYVDAVTRAGGLPIILPALESLDDIRRYVELADGFVLIGGADIDPVHYGQDPHETWNPLNPRRESFDLILIREILAADKPILAVCLGMQELNVATGGTLIQDIPSEPYDTLDHRPRQGSAHLAHDVVIEESSRLYEILGTTHIAVNSLHHQACGQVGEAVVVTARAPDSIIEAIELPAQRFAIGVQWHPEHLTHMDEHFRLFTAFVEAAGEPQSTHEDTEQYAGAE